MNLFEITLETAVDIILGIGFLGFAVVGLCAEVTVWDLLIPIEPNLGIFLKMLMIVDTFISLTFIPILSLISFYTSLRILSNIVKNVR